MRLSMNFSEIETKLRKIGRKTGNTSRALQGFDIYPD
jgi:hypothetical protein